MAEQTPAEMREAAERLREIAHGTPEYAVAEFEELEAGADALDGGARVLDIHQPVTPGIYALSECWHCSDRSSDPVPWPCETAQAVLGDRAYLTPCPATRDEGHGDGMACILRVNHDGACIFTRKVVRDES